MTPTVYLRSGRFRDRLQDRLAEHRAAHPFVVILPGMLPAVMGRDAFIAAQQLCESWSSTNLTEPTMVDWEASPSGKAIGRCFRFATYEAAFQFKFQFGGILTGPHSAD